MIRNLTLCALLLACGGEDSASEPACEAGRTEACACPDGSMGAQTCASNGESWGICRCDSSSANDCASDDDCSSSLPYCYRGECSPAAIASPGRECNPPAIICEQNSDCIRDGRLGPEIGICSDPVVE